MLSGKQLQNFYHHLTAVVTVSSLPDKYHTMLNYLYCTAGFCSILPSNLVTKCILIYIKLFVISALTVWAVMNFSGSCYL